MTHTSYQGFYHPLRIKRMSFKADTTPSELQAAHFKPQRDYRITKFLRAHAYVFSPIGTGCMKLLRTLIGP